MDVQNAGKRLPTPRSMAMMRVTLARATYTISRPSSVAMEQDSCIMRLNARGWMRGRGERHGRNIGMAQCEDARLEKKVPIVVGAGETELGERVEAAPDGGARKSGFVADLRNGELAFFLGEGLDDGEAARERGHEIGIAGEGINLRGRGGRRGRGIRRNDGGSGDRNRCGTGGLGGSGVWWIWRAWRLCEYWGAASKVSYQMAWKRRRIHELGDRRTLFR